jgi:hypothetical protein
MPRVLHVQVAASGAYCAVCRNSIAQLTVDDEIIRKRQGDWVHVEWSRKGARYVHVMHTPEPMPSRIVEAKEAEAKRALEQRDLESGLEPLEGEPSIFGRPDGKLD